MWWCGVAWRGVLWLCFMVPFGTDWKSSFKIERSSKVWSVLHKQGPACSAVPDSKMILRPVLLFRPGVQGSHKQHIRHLWGCLVGRLSRSVWCTQPLSCRFEVSVVSTLLMPLGCVV